MGKRKPIENGTRFGSLVVIGIGDDYIQPSNGCRHSTSICLCDCGSVKTITNRDLKKGNTLSCGCMTIEYNRKSHMKHGKRYTRLYRIWSSMKQRCDCPTSDGYYRYGARGISVCEEWTEFINFFNWANDNGYAENLTIERIDVNGNYCPENCKWTTMQEQNNNKANTCKLTYNGETHTLKQWSEITGIPHKTLYRRYHVLKWNIEEVLTNPVDTSKRNHRYDKTCE